MWKGLASYWVFFVYHGVYEVLLTGRDRPSSCNHVVSYLSHLLDILEILLRLLPIDVIGDEGGTKGP